ncbi:4-amino-4-deoxy-L-arabinose transferase-like glycosyltransferase [Wenyingzhuangia heitensis]|uniref:4-amino-4-deoxy-L-arabinose transferase-like glycosyltransferase n=1 Tax=Wenyingzhuangia heitensis TaxID=1487859 RepID=A0ABX0UB11_9FLAO|nr:glycosyltransferase family 39 protein [Wenyingzhuangia heitensis]NIJ46012.1 4-amino-4-deoxy-L-arabinose transferase-like glycosyltransferase [Wenyingzhuangia heitensis]
MILSKKDSYLLYGFLLLVYVCGLFIPIMENDSAQHATMAMRMYLENDFLHIYKGANDYLDKPHMHFWLSAISFKIFGIHAWSYRLPALIFTFIGAFYSNKLAVHFYGKKINHIAALVFLSVQAVILANHDVRTDAVLTGAIALAIYNFVKYLDSSKLSNLILGFLGLAIGFSSKGQLAVFICGVFLFVHIVYANKWKQVFSWKVLVGLTAYVLFISPVLYAYYVQFDLHPEKVFNGFNNISGIRFILWDQSFNRLTGTGFKNNSPDYFFFFHTILWAFLPWPIIMYAGMFSHLKKAISHRFKKIEGFELMSSLGTLLVLLVISTSKFKLPHYLNSLFSIMAVLVVGYLWTLHKNKKIKLLSRWANFQIGLFVFLSVFVLCLSFWAFTLSSWLIIIGIVVIVTLLIVFLKTVKEAPYRKLIVSSVGLMVLINFTLNTQFYPNLLQYQSGITASKIIKKNKIDPEHLYLRDGIEAWSVSFYAHKNLKRVKVANIPNQLKKGEWVYLEEASFLKTKEAGVVWSKIYPLEHYRITRLKLKFLNPSTRPETLTKRYLVQR